MKRILTITSDESLTEGLEAAADLSDAEFETATNWKDAQTQLVESPHQVVCVEYETLVGEGLNAFVELDDILQKNETCALVLLREESSQAEQFVERLDSFEGTVNLSTAPVDEFASQLVGLLESQPDPDTSPPNRAERRPTIELVLPCIDQGTFSSHSIARVVHTLRQKECSGRLILSTDEMQRTVELANGAFVTGNGEGASPIDHLKAAFAWTDGRYEFEPDDSVEGDTLEPYAVLLEGVKNHLDQRTAMEQLMPVMDRYVARTSFLEECEEELRGYENLVAFIEQADGETTLETALSAIASRVLTGFQAGFLAIECDLVALTEEPNRGFVDVEFSIPEDSNEREVTGGREGVSPTSSAATSHEEPDTEQREAELRRTHDRVAAANPYEVFDLWEGCGEENVRDRYFKLVKRHHPDSYGGNISDEGKELAEEIFIRIKQAHSELLSMEGEQEVSRDEAVESSRAEESGLDQALTSPSVTAMGGDDDEQNVAKGGAPPDASSDPSLEMGPTTEEMAAPAASKRPSTEKVEPADNEAHMRHGHADENAESGDALEEDETVERRADKLDEIRNRLENKSGGSGRQTPVAPDSRGDKLASLRDSSTDGGSEADSLDPSPPQSDEEAQDYFNLGYRAFENEDRAQAHRFFELAHSYDSSNALWATFYAYTLFLQDSRQRDEAQKLLVKVIKSDDKQAKPDAHLFLGRLLKDREEHEQARKHFERATELDPNSVEAKRELRLYEMREDESHPSDDSDGFLSNLLDQDLF